MKRILTIVLVFTALSSIAWSDDSVGQLVAELTFDESSCSVLQPVTARLELRNESDHPIRVLLGNNIDVEVEGARISLPIDGISFWREAVLEPGELLTMRLLLDEWHRFEEPGEYSVRVILDSPPLLVEATQVVTITPRDPESLRAACDRLAAWAVSYESETALIGGKALRNVADEVCLEALAKALRESFHVKEGAIAGLARIGSDEAFQVLAESWDDLRWDQQAFTEYLAARYEKGEALQEALLEAGKSSKPVGDVWDFIIPSWAME